MCVICLGCGPDASFFHVSLLLVGVRGQNARTSLSVGDFTQPISHLDDRIVSMCSILARTSAHVSLA